ncbi:MAG: hypothetical protein KC421_19280, partial [Anaerolineales bacterium]|nr:hypothetical protein [Anaerolineales bacterium]
LSYFQRFYLSYLGYMYAYAFRTSRQRFLGISRRSWLTLLLFLLLLMSFIFGYPTWISGLLFLIIIWLRFTYWRAAKAGYSKFVADKTAVSPPADLKPLEPNERIKLRATGLFALSSRETNVLLRPAEYWKVPLGEHAVMVEQQPQSFLYQFFNRDTIEDVRVGWLIFGRQPRRTLAVTFCSKWGKNFTDFSQLYYVRGRDDTPPCERREIYFTFANDREHTAVWHTILQDVNHKMT